METSTQTISKTPLVPRLRWHVTADNQRAENSDHRDGAAAEARHRTAIRATTATETSGQWCPVGRRTNSKIQKMVTRADPSRGIFRYISGVNCPSRDNGRVRGRMRGV